MNKNFYAIIIGFNKFADQTNLPELEFAEKDARDFYEALIDPDCGNYPKENIHLITGNISREDLEQELYVHAVKERGPQDTVVIYYSGHGFIAGDHPESYLATPDTSILKINTNPNAGLSMGYLRKYIFLSQMEKKPKNVIFLLDCCYSGTFCPDIKRNHEERPKALVEAHDFDSDGRVAFVSSPSGVVSREDKSLKNGVFTYYLLQGLRGEASEKQSGEVTVNSLIAFVQAMSPSSQPPIAYGKDPRIVLTRPKFHSYNAQEEPHPATKLYAKVYRPSSLNQIRELVPLENPFEKQINYVDNLIKQLSNLENYQSDNELLGNLILKGIGKSLNANFIFLNQLKSPSELRHKFLSDVNESNLDTTEIADRLTEHIFPALTQDKAKLYPMRFGFFVEADDVKGAAAYSMIIPLKFEYPREFLVINGVDTSALSYGEILGHILLNLYRATLEFSILDLMRVENFLIDEIKRSFGHVPYHIYATRFTNFKKHLNEITFAYQPVVSLGRRRIEIDSWEALARDPRTKRALSELFQAAELWGPEFSIELDLYCLRGAVSQYCPIWERDRGRERMDPLAVNVYPETLYRRAYEAELFRIVKDEELIKGKNLVLEISDKKPLSWVDRLDEQPISNPTETFAKLLNKITRTVGIGFAIDDFGVGHSSADRLTRLKLDYVKIDRDILQHPYPHYTIQYVLDIVQSVHANPIKIVVEGFDGQSRISLADLYRMGVVYLQGDIIRKAKPQVDNLEDEIKKFILQKINVMPSHNDED